MLVDLLVMGLSAVKYPVLSFKFLPLANTQVRYVAEGGCCYLVSVSLSGVDEDRENGHASKPIKTAKAAK